MGKKRRKTLADGRSGGEQYLQLPYSMARSLAWRSLSGNAAKVWIELRCRFDGRNNGQLCLSFADGSKLLGISHGSLGRAFKELETRGFIKRIKQGHWYGRKATEWAVTYRGYAGYLASNDWSRWQPPAKPKT